MENVKIIENAEQQPDIVADEKENFDAFISAMVQIVEKYGKISSARFRLCCVILRNLTYHIFLNYRR